MGQPVPQSQPEDSDSGRCRSSQRCGCQPADRDDSGTCEKSPDQDAGSTYLCNDVTVASSEPPIEQRGVPFVVQSGQDLFMVAAEAPQWVVAELRFDTTSCTFVEANRSRYDWPREAFGSMLARVAVGDEIDHELISRVTADFSRWLASQFIVVRRP